MAYIRVSTKLAENPRLFRLARALHVGRAGALGRIVAVWHWALDHAQDGVIDDGMAADIAQEVEWDDPASLMEALRKSGFLEGNVLWDWENIGVKALRRQQWDNTWFSDEWQDIRRKIISRDGLVCGLCHLSVDGDDVHIDHIIPRSKGGSNDLGNLRVTHSTCNLRRGNRD